MLTPTPPTSLVLVHGAWADGSTWAKRIPPLAAPGLNIVAPSLSLTSLAAAIIVPVPRPLWLDLPGWYLLAEHDRMTHPDTQRFMANPHGHPGRRSTGRPLPQRHRPGNRSRLASPGRCHHHK